MGGNMRLRNKKTGEIFYPDDWEAFEPAEKKQKRYRLIKDLPTFKAGDEFYIAQTGALWYDGGGDDYEDDVCAYATQTLMKFPNILEEWFEEMKPAEPLIKDEKIRKAVRAWADANNYGKDEEYQFEDFLTGWKSWSLEHKGNGDDNEIHFNGGIDFDKMNHQGYYTIAELCGEEEE